MKLTQYITTKELTLEQREIFPSVPLSGAKTLTAAPEASNDFLGFGVAITGSSCYLLAQMEPEARRTLMESIYGKNGLGLSVARLTVGSSDYSAELYSYDDVENDVELKHFSIDRDRAYIIPMIQEILAVNPDLYLYSSPWSPPGWMKTGGSMCGGFMRAEYLECYANYYVKFLQAYEACGIHISALTPQNETETHQKGLMPACLWHPELEAEFVKILRRKLTENGMDVKIWIYDHNFIGADYRVRWQLEHIDGLKQACDGIAFHYYEGAIEQTAALQADFPELKFHFTEGGPRLYDNYGTDWCKWATMISKTLNSGYGSFTGWNLMLDEVGGPNVGPFFCGGLVTKNSVTGALSYSGQYRALCHVAPFLQKGAKIYPLQASLNKGGVFTYPSAPTPMHGTLIVNPDGTHVYLLVNADAKKSQVQFELNGQCYYAELLPDSVSTIVAK